MDIEYITKELNKKFAAPLKEYYPRRVVFWYDPDKEFAEDVQELVLDNAKVFALTGSNGFEAKLTLHSDAASNYLLYCPLAYKNIADNWLLDVELYSEEFRADVVSLWMEELHIPGEENLRKHVQQNKKFFNAKERRNKFAALIPDVTTSKQIYLGIMAVLTGSKEATLQEIVKTILCDNLDNEINAAYQALVNYGCQGALHRMVATDIGYSEGDDFSIKELARHIIVSALAKTVREEALTGLNAYFAGTKQAFCYDLVAEWMRSDKAAQYYDVSQTIERDLDLQKLLGSMAKEEILHVDCLPCINECVLKQMLDDVAHNIIDVKGIEQAVDARKPLLWYSLYDYFYEALLAVAQMQDFYLQHGAGFHMTDPVEIWQSYCDDFYKMDSYYMSFYQQYRNVKQSTYNELDDLFKQAAEVVDNLYNNWYLANLTQNWTNAAGKQLAETGYIEGIEQQTDFYEKHVAQATSRTFVIISDAMRYEVAASLSRELEQEMQGSVSLTACQGIFPTVTHFGMAALLPHKELSVEAGEKQVAVMADGMSTSADYRQKVLQAYNPNSVAIPAKKLLEEKREQRKARVKGMDAVYIYHDVIDSNSHNDNPDTCAACRTTINEIKNIMRIIVNDFGGSHIIVTADHGFLYTHRELTESNKTDVKDFREQAVEMGRRHVILASGVTPEYLLPVKLVAGDGKLRGFAARESIRLKSSGKSTKFVHGGVSLQEMAVPIIDFAYYRNSSVGYKQNKDKFDAKPVALGCNFTGNTINNPVFSLSFYQKEPVALNRLATNYKLYFTNIAGKPICQPCIIVADKISANEQERIFKVHFSLHNQPYDKKEKYYLIIEAANGSIYKQIEFTIDIAFDF